SVMDDIAAQVPFGVGRKNKKQVDHLLFDDQDWNVYKEIGTHEHDKLKALARQQLGTVGSGNHYVDILVDQRTDDVWIGHHYGSDGFGNRPVTGFLNLENGGRCSEKPLASLWNSRRHCLIWIVRLDNFTTGQCSLPDDMPTQAG